MNAFEGEKVKACQLHYDIPTRLHYSPVGLLRRFAVPVSGSVWCVPEEHVSRIPFEKWRAMGITTFGLVRYHEDEVGAIRKLAHGALVEEAGRIRKALTHSFEQSVQSFEAAERLASADDVKKARNKVLGSISRAKREMKSAEECAFAFDLTREVSELFEGIKLEISARHRAFYARGASPQADMELEAAS